MLPAIRIKAERRLARWLHRRPIDLSGKPSVVCFTFDDVPRSACTHGARIVEVSGGRATYYVCGTFADQSDDGYFFGAKDLRRLEDAGHEIGSHGFAHCDYQRCGDDVPADLDANDRYLAGIGITPPTQFAFPFGSVDPRVKRLCADRFTTSRGVERAPNASVADTALLKAVQLYDTQLTDADIDALMLAASRGGTWLIFLSHAVANMPGEFDTSPRQLSYAAQAAIRHDLPILTMSQASRHFAQDA